MLNKQEIQEAIEVLFPDGFSERHIGGMHPDDSDNTDDGALKDGYLWCLEDEWGGEGDGAEMSVVYKITRLSDNQAGFIQFDGVYSSWDSSEWDDDYTVVEPREVMKTRYFEV